MGVPKLPVFITLLLMYKVRIALSEKCTRLNSGSGIISNEKRNVNRYSNCWKINVLSNTYVYLNMDSFYSSNGGCSYSRVVVSIGNRNDRTFCPGQSTWQPVLAFDDVTVTHYVNSSGYITSRFSMNYRPENIPCIQKNAFECHDGECISKFQVCDGIRQCSDGEDEEGCETGVFAVPGVEGSRIGGLRWLLEKWSTASGWQDNTHRGVIALHLATEKNSPSTDLKRELMVKQLEVQALASLLRNETGPLTASQLSMLVNALTVSCQDPRNFHGFDLVKLLKDEVKASPLTTHPVAHLALCNAGETTTVNATGDLCNVLNTDSEYPFLLDIQAVAVMALSCMRANQQDGSNSSVLSTEYEEAVKKLKLLQLGDGSFGDIYTSAIVTQALLSAGEENNKDWKLNAAINHLMRHLNSSSTDFLATYLILPVLNGKSLSDIRNTNCSGGLQQRSQGDTAPEVKNKLGPKMRIQYFLYIGDERDIIHSISLRTPENITVFEIMQLAEEADAKYRFQWKKMGQKLYIYDIAGIINDFEDGLFWLLYVKKDANSVITHAKGSPDKEIVHDGAQIIMWYKKTYF